MTPRALDPDRVAEKLRLMSVALDVLDELGDLDAEALAGDAVQRGAVERYLSQLVDLAAAVNAHLSAAELAYSPTDYTDSFRAAARAGAIPHELAEALAPSAGLRNILVHDYASVDLAKVAAAIPLARRDFRRYVIDIAAFVRGPGATATE